MRSGASGQMVALLRLGNSLVPLKTPGATVPP